MNIATELSTLSMDHSIGFYEMCWFTGLTAEICYKGCEGKAKGINELVDHPDALECGLDVESILECHRDNFEATLRLTFENT